MELFHAPAGLHELDGEEVEQFGVRWRIALLAEVFGRYLTWRRRLEPVATIEFIVDVVD
jgi:hypothetical protein